MAVAVSDRCRVRVTKDFVPTFLLIFFYIGAFIHTWRDSVSLVCGIFILHFMCFYGDVTNLALLLLHVD